MFDSIEAALEDLKLGKPVIVVDDEDRENEGDLIAVSEYLTVDTINFMAKFARGLIVRLLVNRLQLNDLHLMTSTNDKFKTAFTVSVDHISTTTGISAFERTDTIKALISESSGDALLNQDMFFR